MRKIAWFYRKQFFCCGDFQGTYLADINLSGNGKRPPGRRRSFRSKEKVKMLEGTMKHKKDVNHVLRFILYNKFFIKSIELYLVRNKNVLLGNTE